nr:hypothetical protein [Arachnia sp.]
LRPICSTRRSLRHERSRLGRAESKGLTIFFALISIIAGFTLMSSPLMGAVFLWWFLAIGMIVMGVLNVGRALFGRKKA